MHEFNEVVINEILFLPPIMDCIVFFLYCMCACVYGCICAYMCTCVCVFVHACECVCIGVVWVCMCVFVHACVCVCNWCREEARSSAGSLSV